MTFESIPPLTYDHCAAEACTREVTQKVLRDCPHLLPAFRKSLTRGRPHYLPRIYKYAHRKALADPRFSRDWKVVADHVEHHLDHRCDCPPSIWSWRRDETAFTNWLRAAVSLTPDLSEAIDARFGTYLGLFNEKDELVKAWYGHPEFDDVDACPLEWSQLTYTHTNTHQINITYRRQKNTVTHTLRIANAAQARVASVLSGARYVFAVRSRAVTDLQLFGPVFTPNEPEHSLLALHLATLYEQHEHSMPHPKRRRPLKKLHTTASEVRSALIRLNASQIRAISEHLRVYEHSFPELRKELEKYAGRNLFPTPLGTPL